MWTQLITLTTIIVSTSLGNQEVPDINREVNEGIKSAEYQIIGVEDLTVTNQVVSDLEKSKALKSRVNLNEAIKPLAAEDVKCLSVDRYCSKEMRTMKSVLIQAIKEDCTKCSDQQKTEAGKLIASMMAHNPVAWKLFLTRYDSLNKAQEILA